MGFHIILIMISQGNMFAISVKPLKFMSCRINILKKKRKQTYLYVSFIRGSACSIPTKHIKVWEHLLNYNETHGRS